MVVCGERSSYVTVVIASFLPPHMTSFVRLTCTSGRQCMPLNNDSNPGHASVSRRPRSSVHLCCSSSPPYSRTGWAGAMVQTLSIGSAARASTPHQVWCLDMETPMYTTHQDIQ
jgi:hypothetical protein